MDDDVIHLSRPGMSLSDMLDLESGSPAEAPAEAGDDDFPRPGDEYAAAGRVANRPEEMIAFLMRDQSEELFSYACLERVRLLPPDGPGKGWTLILRFAGSVVIEARIEGRNLRPLVPGLRRQRIPWLRETPLPGEFAMRAATTISRIVIEAVER